MRDILLLTATITFMFAAPRASAQVVRPDSVIANTRWNSPHLHSSVHPDQWVPSSRTEQHGQAQPLKEPIVPFRTEADMRQARIDRERAAEDAKRKAAAQPSASSTVVFQTGMATYYSARTHGRMMADGTRYDRDKLFCAHRTLPFGTRVRVVNKKNGREVVVVVRDRGPFAKGRIIDLSNKAAEQIGMLSDGVVPVELYIVEKKE